MGGTQLTLQRVFISRQKNQKMTSDEVPVVQPEQERDSGNSEDPSKTEETIEKDGNSGDADFSKDNSNSMADSTEKSSVDMVEEKTSKEDMDEEKTSKEDDEKIPEFKALSEEEQKDLVSRVDKLENYLNKDIREICKRTDLSAFNKVLEIANIIKKEFDPAEIKKPEPEVKGGDKKAAPEYSPGEVPKAKVPKPDGEGGDKEDKTSDDEDAIDSCVVCGLYLNVFKEDHAKELHHYLSHGFNILKEFDILKPNDMMFLVCNLCGSPFPKKCHGNFRKHLVSEHQEKIVEIF